MTEEIEITPKLLQAGCSGNGGWNRRQIEALGIKWPLTHGWKDRAIGTVIPRKNAALFLELRDATKRPRKIRGPNLIRSDLPFTNETGETEKRVVDSFWRWLHAQPENTRRQLQDPLVYIVRKNISTIEPQPK